MEVNVGQNKLFWHPWFVHISLWKRGINQVYQNN